MSLRRPAVLICAVYAAVLSFSIYFIFPYDFCLRSDVYDLALAERSVELYGTVRSARDTGETVYGTRRGQAVLDVARVVYTDASGRIVVRRTRECRVLLEIRGGFDAAGSVGMPAVAKGMLSLAQPRRNPHTFDYSHYLASKKIKAVMTARPETDVSIDLPGGGVIRRGAAGRILGELARIRVGISERLDKYLPERYADLARGMIFGDRNGIDEDVYEMYRRNGTAHILAVSGIHVGIVYACVTFLFGGRKSAVFSAVTLVFLIGYACMADFSPSVLRAVAMIAMHMAARGLNRRYDMLSAAAVTAVAFMICNPFIILNTGFILSYAAILSIAVFVPGAARTLGNGRTAKAIAPAVGIQGAMAPLTAYLFNYFSLPAFIINIPVVFLAGFIVPAGMVFCAVSAVSTGIPARFAAEALRIPCALLDKLNTFSYADGATSFDVVSPDIAFMVVYYGALFFLLSDMGAITVIRKQKKKAARAAACVTAAALLCGALSGTDCDGARVVFVDVGQGDCLHVLTPSGKNILIDSGGSATYDVGKNTLMPYLLKNGVARLDCVFLTHLHTDHYEGLVSLSERVKVDRIAVYEANMLAEEDISRETGVSPGNITYMKAGDRVDFGDGVTVTALYPAADTYENYRRKMSPDADENDISLILKLDYDGLTVLMTGDIGEKGENDLVSMYYGTNDLDVDILKIAHHGSKYSTTDAFLAATDPGIAVIQVGKNNYGHPSPTVIEKCAENDIMLFRNDTDGAVCLVPEKNGTWRAATVIHRSGYGSRTQFQNHR